MVLQVLEMFKIWIWHILQFSGCQKRLANTESKQQSEMAIGKIYADIIAKVYLIVHDRIRLDVS